MFDKAAVEAELPPVRVEWNWSQEPTRFTTRSMLRRCAFVSIRVGSQMCAIPMGNESGEEMPRTCVGTHCLVRCARYVPLGRVDAVDGTKRTLTQRDIGRCML